MGLDASIRVFRRSGISHLWGKDRKSAHREAAGSVYLDTSDDVQGLIAQGHTIVETIEIARDVAKKLIEAQTEEAAEVRLPPAPEAFDYPLIINA